MTMNDAATATRARRPARLGGEPADVFVVFGIPAIWRGW